MATYIYEKLRTRNLIFILPIMLVILFGCKDSEIFEEHVPAAIKIATRVTADEDLDNSIKSLRIMTFERGSTIRNNIFYDEAYLNSNNPIIHEMLSGVYDFVFIANEESDGSENSELTASAFGTNKTINSLNAIAIPAYAINQRSVIPMLTRIDNVTVLPGFEGIKIDGGMTQMLWAVLMKRLAVRVDIILHSQADLTNQFQGVQFSNIPDNIPLLGNYSGLQNVSKPYTIPNNLDNFEVLTGTEYLWAIKIKRIILPSNIFTPENTLSRALRMTLIIDPWSGELPSATIGIDEPFNYTLPPNTQFMGEGIVGPLLDLNLNAFDWDAKDILGDIEGRILNISATKVSVTGSFAPRIYFYTNQKKVSIDPIGRIGNSMFDVNNVFKNLVGSTPYNLDFNADTGQGFIDIETIEPSVAGDYIIYLNVGGLLRAITVNIPTS